MVNLDDYYVDLTNRQKKVIDMLKKVKEPIQASKLAELIEVDIRNFSKVVKSMVLDGIIKESVVSPEGSKIRYKYYSLENIENIDKLMIENVKKDDKGKPRITRIIKKDIDLTEIREQLKKEIMNEMKSELIKNESELKARNILSQFIAIVPIREQDKKALGLEGTNQEIRTELIRLIDIL
jgi:predicted transcriptional regulator